MFSGFGRPQVRPQPNGNANGYTNGPYMKYPGAQLPGHPPQLQPGLPPFNPGGQQPGGGMQPGGSPTPNPYPPGDLNGPSGYPTTMPGYPNGQAPASGNATNWMPGQQTPQPGMPQTGGPGPVPGGGMQAYPPNLGGGFNRQQMGNVDLASLFQNYRGPLGYGR